MFMLLERETTANMHTQRTAKHTDEQQYNLDQCCSPTLGSINVESASM